jgi:hypothetical protein
MATVARVWAGQDFDEAAFVFQHGDRPDDYLLYLYGRTMHRGQSLMLPETQSSGFKLDQHVRVRRTGGYGLTSKPEMCGFKGGRVAGKSSETFHGLPS